MDIFTSLVLSPPPFLIEGVNVESYTLFTRAQVLRLALEFNMLGVPYCVLLAYIEARACHNNAKEDDSCLNTDHQNSSPTTKKLDINFAAENIKSDLFWILSTSCPPLQFHSNEFHFDLREFRIR